MVLIDSSLPTFYFWSNGRLIMMGASATLTLSPELLSPDFLFKHYHIIGSGQNDREYLYEALYYVAKSKVRVMTEIFPLEHIIFL